MQLDTPFLLFTTSVFGLLNHWFLGQVNAKECRHWDGRNQDEALFLTPLILSGQLEEAKALSEVCALPADVEVPSYSGFITVNAEFNSNLFFWFVPSLTDPKNAPVLLWLQGGPGTSSLLGFFVEHGPYSVSSDFTEATFRHMTWTNRYSVLYVDQPVGTGFSFTDDEAGYARNLTDVARDILEFLQQFFTLFDDLAQNEFYITGESYGGKYVPAVGAALHKNAPSMRLKINFRGIAYGNGVTDPVNMLEVGEFAYATGLIDRSAADYMKKVAEESREHIHAGRTELAFHNMNHLLIGYTKTRDSFFKNITGFEYLYNYLQNKVPKDFRTYNHFVTMPAVRRAIHVGQRIFSTTLYAVLSHFFEDFMRSAVPELTIVLDNGYRVLVYSGPLDIAVPTTNTVNFLSKMSWSGAGRWARAPQNQWHSADGQTLYGYKKSVDNLHFVVVRNSGHLVPYDTPQAAFSLITAFVDASKPFNS
ncbi:venom serine carboxypeptidase-like [Haemaphysalis longicornis]